MGGRPPNDETERAAAGRRDADESKRHSQSAVNQIFSPRREEGQQKRIHITSAIRAIRHGDGGVATTNIPWWPRLSVRLSRSCNDAVPRTCRARRRVTSSSLWISLRCMHTVPRHIYGHSSSARASPSRSYLFSLSSLSVIVSNITTVHSIGPVVFLPTNIRSITSNVCTHI